MPANRLLCCILLGTLSGCSLSLFKSAAPPANNPPQPGAAAVKAPQDSAAGLAAARAAVSAGDYPAAQRQLDALPYANLIPAQRSQYNLLAAAVYLHNADAEQALAKLESVRPSSLSKPEQIEYFQTLAFAHALAGNRMNNIYARARLIPLLPKQERRADMTGILDALLDMPLTVLNKPYQNAEDINGWLALAAIIQQNRDEPEALADELKIWRLNYPGHVADKDFIEAYLKPKPAEKLPPPPPPPIATPFVSPAISTPADVQTGPRVAVLLPETGGYAAAAKAIKTGMLAAQKQAQLNGQAAGLTFYDTETADIATLYAQAVAAGAQYVVGPLTKEHIQQLAESSDLSAPVLALNHVENLSKPNLYQFGLSPLDDAAALAAKAARDGRRYAWILSPDNAQGRRLGRYLRDAWLEQAGMVLEEEYYEPKRHDLLTIISRWMSSPLPPGGGEPALLLAAAPEAARELMPRLRQLAGPPPAIYALPGVYSGRPNPLQDAELGGVTLCDIPWLFSNAYAGPLTLQALQPLWQPLADSQIRLLALGLDAYALPAALPHMAEQHFPGATGWLGLDEDGRVNRKLACAQFHAGLPTLSGAAE